VDGGSAGRSSTTPPNSTLSFSDNPGRLAQERTRQINVRIFALWAWRCWSPGIFNIPAVLQAYAGNQNDSVTFSRFFDDLVARYQMFKEKCQSITLVFDKGIIRKTTFRRWTILPTISLARWSPRQHPDLWDIPLERFRYVKTPSGRLSEFIAPRRKFFGRKRTIVITRSRALLQGQIRGIRQHLAKKLHALRDLQKRIARSHEPGWKGQTLHQKSIQKNLDAIISGQYIADFSWGKVTHQRGNGWGLNLPPTRMPTRN